MLASLAPRYGSCSIETLPPREEHEGAGRASGAPGHLAGILREPWRVHLWRGPGYRSTEQQGLMELRAHTMIPERKVQRQ